MPLTAAEETFVKKQKQISDLESEKETLISTANTAMESKQAEIEAIRTQLETDVAAKDAEINAIK